MPMTLEMPLDLELSENIGEVTENIGEVTENIGEARGIIAPAIAGGPVPVDLLIDSALSPRPAEPGEFSESMGAIRRTSWAIGDDSPMTDAEVAAELAKQKAEREFKAKLAKATDILAAAALELHDADNRRKWAKKDYERAVEALDAIAKRGPELDADDGEDDSDEGDDEQAVSGGGLVAGDIALVDVREESDPYPSKPADPNAWRSVPVGDLGLRPVLTEKLTDAGLATMGKLEDRRAEVYSGREKWPKGIGKAKVTEIEDALLAWLSKNRDAAVLAAAAATTPANEATSPAEQSAASEPEQSVVDDQSDDQPDDQPPSLAGEQPTPSEWQDMTPETRNEFLEKRMNELVVYGLKPRFAVGGYWEQGRQSRETGENQPPPFAPSLALDDWLRGWMSADPEWSQRADAALKSRVGARAGMKALRNGENVADAIAVGKQAASDAAADPLILRAEELDDGSPDCLQPKLADRGHWDFGVIAFGRGDKLTSCPHRVSGDMQDDWLRGFMHAEAEASKDGKAVLG